MKYYVGIDLGGTNIVAGVVNEDYTIIAKATVKTNCPRPSNEIADDMVKVASEAVANAGLTMDDIESIGVGTPGIANSSTGFIEFNNNLGFMHVPIAEYIGAHINKPIYVENDANAAAYGEFVAGAAKGANNVICITLGTGVGSGIIINKKIIAGFNYAAGEIGHTVIEVDGAKCNCGRKGCFEAYSSATGLIRMTKEAMESDKSSMMWGMSEEDGKVSARLAFNAMRAGDSSAKAVVEKYIKYLSTGLANVINTFMPEILCIGGGVCNEGDTLLIPVKELVQNQVYTSNIKDFKPNTEIVIAKLGNDAGIIGAAFLGFSK